MIISSEISVFCPAAVNSPNERFLIHRPGPGENKAITYAATKNQSRWRWMKRDIGNSNICSRPCSRIAGWPGGCCLKIMRHYAPVLMAPANAKRGKVSAQAGSGIPALQMISRSLCLDLSRACRSVLISDGEAGWPHLFSSATGQGQYTPALSGNIFPAAVFRPA